MTPTWRKPFGVLAIVALITIYAVLVASFSGYIGSLPILLQAMIYIALGIAWIFPVRPMLVWMETGRFRPPS